ncbi:hypothetical protein G7Y79_00014g037070 [Physcia stellaris]|nr:hypothetical protein G7Y79_00014g037070 [Physcia stellaris]
MPNGILGRERRFHDSVKLEVLQDPESPISTKEKLPTRESITGRVRRFLLQHRVSAFYYKQWSAFYDKPWRAFYYKPWTQLAVRGILKTVNAIAIGYFVIRYGYHTVVFGKCSMPWRNLGALLSHSASMSVITMHMFTGGYRCYHMLKYPAEDPLTRTNDRHVTLQVAPEIQFAESILSLVCSVGWIVHATILDAGSLAPQPVAITLAGLCLSMAGFCFWADWLVKQELEYEPQFSQKKHT